MLQSGRGQGDNMDVFEYIRTKYKSVCIWAIASRAFESFLKTQLIVYAGCDVISAVLRVFVCVNRRGL